MPEYVVPEWETSNLYRTIMQEGLTGNMFTPKITGVPFNSTPMPGNIFQNNRMRQKTTSRKSTPAEAEYPTNDQTESDDHLISGDTRKRSALRDDDNSAPKKSRTDDERHDVKVSTLLPPVSSKLTPYSAQCACVSKAPKPTTLSAMRRKRSSVPASLLSSRR